MEILKVEKLCKTYGKDNTKVIALDNVSFSVEKGEFVAIVGPSGCGKSTILSVLCGLEEKSGGEISLNKDSNVGYMLQQDSLFEWRNILDNCLLGLEINKSLSDNSKKRVIDLLNTYGLKDFIYSYPDNLSGGMRQRVVCI